MRPVTKALLIAIGTLSLALGIVGMFLPVLPTTPFLLLTAWCYARSSERFYIWFVNHRVFGTCIRNHVEKRGVPLRTKVYALILLWSGIMVSVIFAVRSLPVRILLLTIAACVTVHIVNLKTLCASR